jgi:hypothetical protein
MRMAPKDRPRNGILEKGTGPSLRTDKSSDSIKLPPQWKYKWPNGDIQNVKPQQRPKGNPHQSCTLTRCNLILKLCALRALAPRRRVGVRKARDQSGTCTSKHFRDVLVIIYKFHHGDTCSLSLFQFLMSTDDFPIQGNRMNEFFYHALWRHF